MRSLLLQTFSVLWAHLGAPALLPAVQSQGAPAMASQLISPIPAHGCPVLEGVAHLSLCQPFLQPTAHGKDTMMPETLQNFTLCAASGPWEKKEESLRKQQQNEEERKKKPKKPTLLYSKRNLSLPGVKKRRGGREMHHTKGRKRAEKPQDILKLTQETPL